MWNWIGDDFVETKLKQTTEKKTLQQHKNNKFHAKSKLVNRCAVRCGVVIVQLEMARVPIRSFSFTKMTFCNWPACKENNKSIVCVHVIIAESSPMLFVFSYLFIIITAVTLKAFTNRSHEITSTASNTKTHTHIHDRIILRLNEFKSTMCVQTNIEETEKRIIKTWYFLNVTIYFFLSYCRCTVHVNNKNNKICIRLLLKCIATCNKEARNYSLSSGVRVYLINKWFMSKCGADMCKWSMQMNRIASHVSCVKYEPLDWCAFISDGAMWKREN